MIARCIHNTGNALGAPIRGGFYTSATVFHLIQGNEYTVMGLGLFETVLLALVRDETSMPNWLPIGLFAFDDAVIPPDWEFVLDDGIAASGGVATDRWVARWGYHELVRDSGHCDALIERDPSALAIFSREFAARSNRAER